MQADTFLREGVDNFAAWWLLLVVFLFFFRGAVWASNEKHFISEKISLKMMTVLHFWM